MMEWSQVQFSLLSFLIYRGLKLDLESCPGLVGPIGVLQLYFIEVRVHHGLVLYPTHYVPSCYNAKKAQECVPFVPFLGGIVCFSIFIYYPLRCFLFSKLFFLHYLTCTTFTFCSSNSVLLDLNFQNVSLLWAKLEDSLVANFTNMSWQMILTLLSWK